MLNFFSNLNWCEALGTVLANDEVKDGRSERGGHPVTKRPMLQWSLRVTAYAERLLEGLKNLEWSESLKTIQRNWIGKSSGAQVFFDIKDCDKVSLSRIAQADVASVETSDKRVIVYFKREPDKLASSDIGYRLRNRFLGAADSTIITDIDLQLAA